MSEGTVQAVCLHPRTQMVKCLLSLKCPSHDSPIGDNELRWEEKFVSTLVKNMLNRSYEELMKALASRGGQPTKCVYIKRLSADGRLQIGSKKVVPHVVAYRIWRNPNIKHAAQLSPRHPPTSYPPPSHAFSPGAATGATNNITPGGGSTGVGGSIDSVCINPYHYSVCFNNTVESTHVSLKSSDASGSALQGAKDMMDIDSCSSSSPLSADIRRVNSISEIAALSDTGGGCGGMMADLVSGSSPKSSSSSSSSSAATGSGGAGRASPSINPVLSSLLTTCSPAESATNHPSSLSSSTSADIIFSADCSSSEELSSTAATLSHSQSSNRFELHSEKIAGLRKRSNPSSASPFYVPVIVGTGVGSVVHTSSDHRQHSPIQDHLSSVTAPAPANSNMLMTTTSPMYGQQSAALMQTSNVPCATSAINVAAAFPSSMHQPPTSSIVHQQDQLISVSAAPFGVQFNAPTLSATNVNERVAHSSGSHVPISGAYATVGGGGGGNRSVSGRGVIQVMQLHSNHNRNSESTSSFSNNCNVFYDLTSPLTPPHTSQNLAGAAPPLTSYETNSMVCVTSGAGIATSTEVAAVPVAHSSSSPIGGGKANWIQSSTPDCEFMEYEDFTNENENQIAEIVAISSTPSSVSTSCETELQKVAPISSVPGRCVGSLNPIQPQLSPQSFPPHSQKPPTHQTIVASPSGNNQSDHDGGAIIASPVGNYSQMQQQPLQQQQLPQTQIAFDQQTPNSSSSSSSAVPNSFNHRTTLGNMNNQRNHHDNQRNFDNNFFPSLRAGITLGTPVRYAEPLFWCQIRYYEFSQQVGEVCYVSPSIFYVDGGTDPSSAERFCLGSLSNVNRQKIVEDTRSGIGKGLQLYRTRDYEVYAECKSESALFVQSQCCNLRYNWHPGTVCKIPPKCNLKLFTMSEFEKYLNQQLRADNSFKSILEMTSLCSIRISFIKGWGQEYTRKRVTDVPCWIEILLNGPSQWLDQVLQRINPSSEPCDSR